MTLGLPASSFHSEISIEKAVDELINEDHIGYNGPHKLAETPGSWKINYMSWKKRKKFGGILIKYENLIKKICAVVNNHNLKLIIKLHPLENKSLFKNTQIKTEFRSIEPILDSDGKPIIHEKYDQLYESVSIRNHLGLETVNLKKYIPTMIIQKDTCLLKIG